MTTEAIGRRAPGDPDLRYQLWILERMVTLEERRRQRAESERLAYRPTISILTPVYNTPPDVLRRMLDAVSDQTYPFWQHCLVDDDSSEAWIGPFLERHAAGDERIVFHRREENGGIVAASDDAVALATGEFVAILDHDDELPPQALYTVARLLEEHPDADLIYSDMDLIGPDGTRGLPFWKPDWSPDRLLSINYLAHLNVYRRELMHAVGGFREGFEGSQDYDLALRVTERTDRIFHIPDVLYHWRTGPTSAAAGNTGAKPYAYLAARRALADHLARQGIDGTVEDGAMGSSHRVRYRMAGQPLVTLIFSAMSLNDDSPSQTVARFHESLASIVRDTEYERYEVVAVTTAAVRDEVKRVLASFPIVTSRVVTYDGLHDYGRVMNLGAAEAQGEYLVFLGEPLEVLTGEWLGALLEHAQREPIGAVGPKIYSRSGSIEHAGLVVVDGVPRQMFRGVDGSSLGHRASLKTVGNYLAVSGACLMTRRGQLEALGGFNPSSEVGYSDVDYCLRLRDGGCRTLFTPHAELRQIGPPAMDRWLDEGSLVRFRERWRDLGPCDPYYNPNLEPEREDFTVRLSSR